MEVTLTFSGENSNTAALSRGLVSIPTPARPLSAWATPEKDKVQPLSRSLLPEPMLCVEVSPTISSSYRSASCTSSGSFPSSEVTFHLPRASLCCRRSAHPGLPPDPPPGLHCTRPRCLSLRVVGPQGGCSMVFIRAEPDRAPWAKARPPDAHLRAPLLGLAPGGCPGFPGPSEVAKVRGLLIIGVVLNRS
ncbi:hypothetical protein VZT92_000740 [Zoarces viviparus]|uniref:Uncharacterized protein n=1 Tax=Zoarces viviparus TaxID=48416 RepID=A0AAW1G7W9_ZOAVI